MNPRATIKPVMFSKGALLYPHRTAYRNTTSKCKLDNNVNNTNTTYTTYVRYLLYKTNIITVWFIDKWLTGWRQLPTTLDPSGIPLPKTTYKIRLPAVLFRLAEGRRTPILLLLLFDFFVRKHRRNRRRRRRRSDSAVPMMNDSLLRGSSAWWVW